MAGFDQVMTADLVVVGSGVAGMTTALEADGLDVLLVTKTALGGGSTQYAQGGVAVALAPGDSPRTHADDTVAVGAGLNDLDAVMHLTSGGPEGVGELIERGARFDIGSGGLALAREAGHSRERVVHAEGDATGAEVTRALAAAVRSAGHVRVLEQTFAVDLVVEAGAIGGITMLGPAGEALLALAPAVVLATGGAGRLYANTTNPPEVTGDGLAMALRAGVNVADLEFVQFHPTALATGRDPMSLLTEAIRGEGATLVDDEGRRFMADVHPDAELAPRDVVARGIWDALQRGRKTFLDATTAVGKGFPDRFPTVFDLCMQDGFDPRRQQVPVSPAAHYHMGGIAVGIDGRASLRGLWAVGEVSRTGVHGANRLASNSLLEGLVFGSDAASDIAAFVSEATPRRITTSAPKESPAGWGSTRAIRLGGGNTLEDGDLGERLRTLMWEHVGVIRDRKGLVEALDGMAQVRDRLPRGASETHNMLCVAHAVATAALARTESRGAHFRRDFPDTDPAWRHSLVFR